MLCTMKGCPYFWSRGCKKLECIYGQVHNDEDILIVNTPKGYKMVRWDMDTIIGCTRIQVSLGGILRCVHLQICWFAIVVAPWAFLRPIELKPCQAHKICYRAPYAIAPSEPSLFLHANWALCLPIQRRALHSALRVMSCFEL